MAQVPLRLCVPPPATPGPVPLRLGGGDPCVVHLPPLLADIDLRTYATAAVAADLPELMADLDGLYDNAVWRGVARHLLGDWRQAGRLPDDTAITHQDGARLRASAGLPWGAGARLSSERAAPHGQLARLHRDDSAPWGAGHPRHAAAEAPHQTLLRRPRPGILAGHRVAAPVDRSTLAAWQERQRRPRPMPVAPWGVSRPTERTWLAPHQPGSWRVLPWVAPWGEGADRYGWGGPWTPPPPPPAPYVGCYPPPRSADLDLREWLAIDRLRLTFRCPGGRWVPRLRSYIVIHDIDVHLLGDTTPIHAASVSLGLDLDGWAWRFSATLLGRDALDAVQPAPDGTPATLVVEIDGHVWHCLVEDWTEDREHGRRGIRVTGRGLTAWLASPYLLPGSGVTDAAMTLQQLVEAHLPLGSGWSVDWPSGTPNWLVPAGAWSWQDQAPIQAIHEALTGVGLVAVPDAADRVLRVIPRYPVLPWDYAAASPDLVIPDGAILRLERRQPIAPQANAVYVHGLDVGGVLARVKRTGSAADRLAQTTSHPLVTHADGARALGSRILAGQHSQPRVRSLTTPLGGAWPLSGPGQLLRVEDGGDVDLGIVNAVTVEAVITDRALTVRQTMAIGEETPNQWAAFARLLPADPLLAGTVQAAHGDGTVTVELIGGGLLRARGSGSVGQTIYVQTGRVVGTAPAMTAFDLEV